MEKLIYILGGDPQSTAKNFEAFKQEVVPALQKAGASRIRICIKDQQALAASALQQGELAENIWGYLSLWVDSRCQHATIKPLVERVCDFQYGYAAAESEQLFHDWEPNGKRACGMNQVVFFRHTPNLSRQEFLDIWLNSHTQIAIDTQSTFGYIQHIVGDKLDEDCPVFHAAVEENFPAAAMTSQEAFYESKGDAESYQRNLTAMIESVFRFIDMESIIVLPMSEYNF